MSKNIFESCRCIDLTHTLHPNIPTWDGDCGFKHTIDKDYPTGCRTHVIRMNEGIGTHMDAPAHFIPGADSISDISIEKFMVPVCVIDVSHRNVPTYQVSENDIQHYEEKYGKIPENCLVIAHTGWDQYWMDPLKYRNENNEGILQIPGFSKTAAEILIERNIVGIGIDTLSPDGSNMSFPVHKLILGSGRYIIENLTNCGKLPPTGAYVIALPLKIQNGTESPIRIIALII